MIAPIDPPTEDDVPLVCPDCGAVGDASCLPTCAYAAYPPGGLDAATDADAWIDERDPWLDNLDNIF